MISAAETLKRCPIVVRIPYGGGVGAVEHHSESPEAQFGHTRAKVVASCNRSTGLNESAGHRQRRPGDLPGAEAPRPRREGRAGRVGRPRYRYRPSRVVRHGHNVTLLSYGPTVKFALKAARGRRGGGAALEVIDLRTLSPLDMGPVLESLRRTGHAMITHEAHVNLGLGRRRRRITERCFFRLEAPVSESARSRRRTLPPASRRTTFPTWTGILDAVDRSFESAMRPPMAEYLLQTSVKDYRRGDRLLAGGGRATPSSSTT